MLKTGTAERSTQARGIFRDHDGAAPERLFRQEEPAAGGTERYHVSAADDPEEISAERTADRVMGGGLFREADGPGLEGGEAELPSADLSEPGSALPAGLQESMGESIGADFSGVRVHTGAGADRASRSLSARAFARGQDLYFREGEYNPDSQEGQHLIAHELAHVADGVGGLHRAPPRQASQPASQQTPPQASQQTTQQRSLPPVTTPLTEDPADPGQVDAAQVEANVNDYITLANNADTLADETGKLTLEDIGTKKAALEDAKDNLKKAAEYQQALDTYLKDKNVGNIASRKKLRLESAQTKLKNLEIAAKQKKSVICWQRPRRRWR